MGGLELKFFLTKPYEKTRMGRVLFSVRVTQRLHFLNFSLSEGLVVFSPLALFTQVPSA